MHSGIAKRYPIAMSRDLRRAKRWILDHARGTERYGLVASSKAHRLKPDAIDIRVNVDPIHWFLKAKTTHAPAITWRMRPRSFRCKAWSSTGSASPPFTAKSAFFVSPSPRLLVSAEP